MHIKLSFDIGTDKFHIPKKNFLIICFKFSLKNPIVKYIPMDTLYVNVMRIIKQILVILYLKIIIIKYLI